MSTNMLKHIEIDNFKSLVQTRMTLEKNTFFIGINGAGKTTILQAIDFLSAIAEGNVEAWLTKRGWERKELTFMGKPKKLIDYKIEFALNDNYYQWEFSFNKDLLRCTYERIISIGDGQEQVMLEVKDGRYAIADHPKEKISFQYMGSILSILKEELLSDKLVSIKTFFTQIRSAELLSPILMKKRAREAKGEIGIGGEKLSAFIDELDDSSRSLLQRELARFFPQVKEIEIRTLKGGWKNLMLFEQYAQKDLPIGSRHFSDGMLRILAILSQLLGTESILLFDELEDGVNQEVIAELISFLLKSPHQTLVTTHSPLLLNYLDDDIAMKSILFVYRDSDGATKTINFYEAIKRFSSIDEKEFDLFGPGEVMQSVNLVELSKKISTSREDLQ